MTRKNIVRTVLSVMLVAALMVSFGAAAFAAKAEFKFELSKEILKVGVEDVVIVSTKSGEYSVKEHLEKIEKGLFEKLTGEKVAYYVALDRYLKNWDYSHREDVKPGIVYFDVTGPTTILIPSEIDVTSQKDLDMAILCIDIPDGTELDVTFGTSPNAGTVKVTAQDGIGTFTIPASALKGYEPGDDFPIVIKYTVDGKDYVDSMNCPAVDGDDNGKNKGNGGNGNGNGNGGNGDGDNGNGKVPLKDGFHGVAFDCAGVRVSILVDEKSPFDDVDVFVEKGNEIPSVAIGNDEVKVWKFDALNLYNMIKFIDDVTSVRVR